MIQSATICICLNNSEWSTVSIINQSLSLLMLCMQCIRISIYCNHAISVRVHEHYMSFLIHFSYHLNIYMDTSQQLTIFWQRDSVDIFSSCVLAAGFVWQLNISGDSDTMSAPQGQRRSRRRSSGGQRQSSSSSDSFLPAYLGWLKMLSTSCLA